jgi:NAD(P)H-nitrite reductase large subunit
MDTQEKKENLYNRNYERGSGTMADPSFAVLQKVRDGKRTFGITPRIPGGFITPDDMIKIAEVARKYNGQLKITSGQRIAILGIKPEQVDDAWQDLGMDPGVRSPYSVKNIEMCPASFCKRAKQNSLKLGFRLEKKYYGKSAPNRLKISVVGCLNACASANGKDIVVLAEPEGYIVRAGGSAGFHPRIPDEIASGLSEDNAEAMVDAVFDYYNETAQIGEKLGIFIDRIGIDVFKEGVFTKYKGQEESPEKEEEA